MCIFVIGMIKIAKDCLLTGQEQACTRITRLFGWFGVIMPKLPNTYEDGCWLPHGDHINRWYPFPDRTRNEEKLVNGQASLWHRWHWVLFVFVFSKPKYIFVEWLVENQVRDFMDMTKNEEAYLASRPNSPPLKKGPFVHSRSLMANIACSTNLVTKPPPGSLSITLLCFFSLYFLLFSFYSSIVMQKKDQIFIKWLPRRAVISDCLHQVQTLWWFKVLRIDRISFICHLCHIPVLVGESTSEEEKYFYWSLEEKVKLKSRFFKNSQNFIKGKHSSSPHLQNRWQSEFCHQEVPPWAITLDIDGLIQG